MQRVFQVGQYFNKSNMELTVIKQYSSKDFDVKCPNCTDSVIAVRGNFGNCKCSLEVMGPLFLK